MDSFELNKIIGAVLMTALIIIGINKLTDSIYKVEKPKQSAYKIEGVPNVASNISSTSAVNKVVEKVDIG